MSDIKQQAEQGLGYLIGKMFQKLEPFLDMILKPIATGIYALHHRVSTYIEKKHIERVYAYDMSRDVMRDMLNDNKLDLIIFNPMNGETGVDGHSHLKVKKIFKHIKMVTDKEQLQKMVKYLFTVPIDAESFDDWSKLCYKDEILYNKDFAPDMNMFFDTYNKIWFKCILGNYILILFEQDIELEAKTYNNIYNQITKIIKWKSI